MNTHLCFKLFIEWQISSAQASMFLPFGVILVLKLSGMEKGQSQHRGLRIGSIVCKLIINIILERIRPWYETKLLKKQNGFRRNRSTADRIYSMKRIHQISNSIKATFIYLICRPSIIIRPFIEEMAVQID